MHWSKYQGGNCVLLYKVFYSSWWWFLIYHVLLFSPLAKASVYTHVSLVLTTQTSLLYNIVCCNIGFHLCLRSCQNRIPWCSVAEAIWPQHALAEQYGQRREWGHFLQRLQRIGKWVPSSAFDKFHMLESHFESSRPYVWSSVCIIWLCAKIQCSSTNQSRSVWNSGTFRGLQPLDTRKSEKLGERLCGVIWQLFRVVCTDSIWRLWFTHLGSHLGSEFLRNCKIMPRTLSRSWTLACVSVGWCLKHSLVKRCDIVWGLFQWKLRNRIMSLLGASPVVSTPRSEISQACKIARDRKQSWKNVLVP